MAIANVASRGGQTYAAFGTTNTLTLTTPDTIAVGNCLIVFLALDNAGTSGAGQFVQAQFTLNPSAGVFIPIVDVTRDPGAASEGVQIYAWMCKVQQTLGATETITFVVPNSVGRAVGGAREFSGVLVRGGSTNLTSSTGNGTTATAPQLTSVAEGELVLGITGVETNAAITGDADVTGGAWNTAYSAQSSSGVAATSVSAMMQYKITSGGVTNQNYASTWAGAADYAVAAVQLSPAETPADPAYPVENPNYPCLAGPEYLPTDTAYLPLDTGTGYNVLFPWPDSSNLNTLFAGTGNFVNPNAKSQHIASLEFTNESRYTASLSDDIETVVLPLREVATTDPQTGVATTARLNSSGGSVVTPSTALSALSNAGGDVVWFDGTDIYPGLAFFFDPTILGNYPAHRVMRVGLRYLAWKDDGAPDIPGEGFDVSVVDTVTVRDSSMTAGASALYGSWLAPEYKRNASYQTRWLGETNLVSRNAFNPMTANYRNNDTHPFTITDLDRMANGVEQFYIRFVAQEGYDLLQTDVFLDYVEMVVELAPERRIYVNNRVISNLINTGGVDTYPFDSSLPGVMRYSLNPSLPAPIQLTAGESSVFTVRQAFPASPSDRYRVNPDGDFFYTFAEALGPALEMYGADQLRGLPDKVNDLPQFFTSVLVNGLPNASPLDTIDTIYGAFMYDPVNWLIYGPFWVDAQQFSYPTFRFAGAGYTQDLTVQVDGATTYDKIRLFVKPSFTTTLDLDVEIEQPLSTPIATATVTVADWQAAGGAFQVGDDIEYREVIVDLSAPITPAAGEVFINVSSADSAVWQVAGIRSNNGFSSFEWFEGDSSDADDPAIVLLCEMPDPDTDIESVEVSSEDTAPCTGESFNVPKITVNNADDYDFVVFQRRLVTGLDWETIQVVEVDGALTLEWTDVGVPWDVANIEYRVLAWRSSDRQSRSSEEIWTGPTTAPGAVFGLTIYGNEAIFLYSPVAEGDLEIQYTPLNPINTVQLHGVDYQIALRAPEERGLTCSAVVAVRNFSKCSTDEVEVAGETFAEGQKSMSPTPFDAIRTLENECRLQLGLPGGHTRWVSLDLGTLSVRTVNGVYLAEITLTDLAPLSEDPYDD